MKQANEIIAKLGLQKHPEGGYFREVYRSSGEISQPSLPPGYDSARNFSTSIYFMLTGEDISAFHRIRSDEIWHFYKGANILFHCISPGGIYEKIVLGSDINSGVLPQRVIAAGTWFAAELEDKNSFALVGCTVSPGFDFRDFELAEKEKLTADFPEHKNIIDKFSLS